MKVFRLQTGYDHPLSLALLLPGSPCLSTRFYVRLFAFLSPWLFLKGKSVVLLYLSQIQRETHWEINKTLQIVWFPLFSHNFSAVPSALLVELSRTIGSPQSPQAVVFCSWRRENYRNLQTIPEMSLLWGYRVFYHFFLDWWRNEDGCGRNRKISKDYVAHLKREWFFGHRLHFGKDAASKLNLLWTILVHLTIFLASHKR